MTNPVGEETPKARRLTAEAFAELIAAPAYEHVKIIHEQKYPRRAPASYQVPFYSTALFAIRKYYRSNNDVSVLTDAIIKLQLQPQTVRTKSNIRVLEVFRDGAISKWPLTLASASWKSTRFGSVEVRFAPDLYSREDDKQRFLIVNPRRQDAEDNIARMTLELGYLILSRNHIRCSISDFEYVNVMSGKIVKLSRMRKSTIDHAEATALMVDAIWDGV